MNKITINETEYTYPSTWDEVTFGTWEEFQLILTKKLDPEGQYSYDTLLDVMVMFTKIPRDIFLNAPVTLFEGVFNTIKFLWNNELDKIEIAATIEMDGNTYYVNDDPNITFGEWIDRDAVLEHYPENEKFSAMIAILLREPNKKYSPDDLKNRQAIIKRQPVKAIFPMINFFLKKKNLLLKSLIVYSQTLLVLRMKISELETYQKSGVGNTSFMSWRNKMLLSSIKYLKGEYTKYLTTLYTYMTRLSQAKINLELSELKNATNLL
jgi:hypothetical protein